MSSNANLSFIDTCWFSLEIVGFHWVFIKLTMKKPSLVMMRECPCSTKTREGLENPSPPPSRFPLAMGFAPLDRRDFPRASPSGNPSGLGVQNPWPREISQDFPRPSRVSGNLGRRGWIFQSLPPLGGARIQSSLWCNLQQSTLYNKVSAPFKIETDTRDIAMYWLNLESREERQERNKIF